MAAPGTSTTSTSGLQTEVATYFDELLISTLDPTTRFLQFGQRRPLPPNRGNIVNWNRAFRLGLGYTLNEGTPISAAKQLSSTNVSATILQFGDVLNISDYAQLVGTFNARKVATERLAVQAAEALDTVVKMAILDQPGGTAQNGTVNHYIKGSSSAYFANSADVTATASDPRMQVSDIRKIVISLRKKNVPTFDGTNYVGVIHPSVVGDVIGDSKWEAFHQYTTPENIYAGEIGRLYGVRFVESTLAPVSAGSANGIALSAAGVSTVAYGTVIFGREFYGVTEIDGGIKTYVVDGADKLDPLNQTTLVGWKANFISRVLNPSAGVVAWSASGDTLTGASAQSARNGTLNIYFPGSFATQN